MNRYKITVIKTKDTGNQIFVDGKYLTTYIGGTDALSFQIENSSKTDIESMMEIDPICKNNHHLMKIILNYNFCPICGEKCEYLYKNK